MTAQEAVDVGFATSVTTALAVKASYSEDRLPENVRLAFKAQAPAPVEPAPTAGEHVTGIVEVAEVAARLFRRWRSRYKPLQTPRASGSTRPCGAPTLRSTTPSR